jgi:single-strand DNA-binding protein
MPATSEIPTYVSLEGRLAADPVLQRSRTGRSFVRVQVEAQPPPVPLGGDQFADVVPVVCDLVVFGKAAARMTSRFRFGDWFVASGRLSEDGPTAFIARRVGHDAARTAYRVIRARHVGQAAGRARRRRDDVNAPAEPRPGDDGPVIAGRIPPDQTTPRTA